MVTSQNFRCTPAARPSFPSFPLRKGLAVAEVEAFLWRSQQFPELLFVLVEPNLLAFEAKTLVADWLAQSDWTRDDLSGKKVVSNCSEINQYQPYEHVKHI